MKTLEENNLQENPALSPPREALRQRVILVEDHPITRAGLAALIGRERDLFVCGETDNAGTALDLITKLRPAIVVTDISLPTINGLELIKNVRGVIPDQRILAISMHDESLYAERAIRAGAHGYMMKNEAADKIVPAIRVILGGDVYLSEDMKGKLVAKIFQNRRTSDTTFPMETLSDREMEVFKLLGDGFTTREIAERLNLSSKTIDSYREHMKAKLNVENGAELVRRAIQWMRVEG